MSENKTTTTTTTTTPTLTDHTLIDPTLTDPTLTDTELLNATKTVPKFDIVGKYPAKCVKVYDGDTIHLVIRYGGVLTKFSCRMYGYNSAELRTTDEEEKILGYKAKKALSALILNKIVDAEFKGLDKYGRPLALVKYGDIDVLQWMIENNHGKEYYGEGEKKY